MSAITIKPVSRFQGHIELPGDKSISHRALLFSALAQGKSEVIHLLESGDVASTAQCLRDLGISITTTGNKTVVEGCPLQASQQVLDCGNSGTTIRLLSGILAGYPFVSTLTGDASLCKRPMKRLAEPLREMGAILDLRDSQFAPLRIEGRPLHAIRYSLPVASAQIKSAILLAGIKAQGRTILEGKIHSRDHTERLLPAYGIQLDRFASTIEIDGGQHLQPTQIQVPGDPSSGAFWMTAACLVENGAIEFENMSLNPTRLGFVEVLKRMGARIQLDMKQTMPEPMGRLSITHSSLKGTTIKPDEIPDLIDEIPLIAVLATQANGWTEVRGAEELRIKESDRIESLAFNLRAMGVKIETYSDGFAIEGPQPLKGADIDTFDDHRIAMAFAMAALVAKGETVIHQTDCVQISYPAFFPTLISLIQ